MIKLIKCIYRAWTCPKCDTSNPEFGYTCSNCNEPRVF